MNVFFYAVLWVLYSDKPDRKDFWLQENIGQNMFLKANKYQLRQIIVLF